MTATQSSVPVVVVGVLAHNEERRIGACVRSLPLDDPRFDIHVVVNGSRDRTAEIARTVGGGRVTVHDWPERGKSRSWNRFVSDSNVGPAHAWIFVDGDAEVRQGSMPALVRALEDTPQANAAAGMPCNGRLVEAYRREMIRTHGMFGDLYALRGEFVERMRASGVRLPDDLIGEDSLVGALAKTDLANLGSWQDARIVPCPDAGFLCEPVRLFSPAGLRLQHRRMINYSVRHFQNRIVTSIMRSTGPAGLPAQLSDVYAEWIDGFTPRRDVKWWWFDRLALQRMRAACGRSELS
jgi:glycosyltransferase involved in cell wall biosynthesis